jgi:hypothetical protein
VSTVKPVQKSNESSEVQHLKALLAISEREVEKLKDKLEEVNLFHGLTQNKLANAEELISHLVKRLKDNLIPLPDEYYERK